MADPVDFEALKAQRLRDVLVKGTYVPCAECGAGKPMGGVLPKGWNLAVRRDRSGLTYTTHKRGCRLAPD